MEEKPKSIWKRSWHGPGSLLLGWLVLMVAFAIIFWVFLLATKTPLAGDELTLLGVLELAATATMLLVLFIGWLFCWRNFKRFAFGVACCATLIGLFYA